MLARRSIINTFQHVGMEFYELSASTEPSRATGEPGNCRAERGAAWLWGASATAEKTSQATNKRKETLPLFRIGNDGSFTGRAAEQLASRYRRSTDLSIPNLYKRAENSSANLDAKPNSNTL